MPKSRLMKLGDYSATFSQLLFRYRVLQGLTGSYQRLRGTTNPTERRKIQLSLWTSVSIVLVDVLVGFICAWLLCYRPEVFFVPIQRAYLYLNNEVLQSVVAWLMDSPAGLQMNRNMVVFLGTISLTVVTYWDALISFCLTSSGYIDVDWVVSRSMALISGVFGMSALMSLLIDLASFSFFHIFFLCLGTSRLWNATVKIIVSFTHFFSGKKYNVLKHRVDNHEFNIDQLILGTVFLSMVVFLSPTVLVFYITYILLWSGVVLLQLVMRALVSIFSLFPILLFVYRNEIPNSKQISCGDGYPGKIVYQVTTVPLSMGDIFEEFVRCAATSYFPISNTNSISQTVTSLMKGTAIIFPKYVHHDYLAANGLDFGYHRLFRRM